MAVRHGGTMAMAVRAMGWISMAMPASRRRPGRGVGPPPAGAMEAFRARVMAAESALAAGRGAVAQGCIEQAGAVLRRRRRGRLAETLEAARRAAARGDHAGARAALRPLLARLSRRAHLPRR